MNKITSSSDYHIELNNAAITIIKHLKAKPTKRNVTYLVNVIDAMLNTSMRYYACNTSSNDHSSD